MIDPATFHLAIPPLADILPGTTFFKAIHDEITGVWPSVFGALALIMGYIGRRHSDSESWLHNLAGFALIVGVMLAADNLVALMRAAV